MEPVDGFIMDLFGSRDLIHRDKLCFLKRRGRPRQTQGLMVKGKS